MVGKAERANKFHRVRLANGRAALSVFAVLAAGCTSLGDGDAPAPRAASEARVIVPGDRLRIELLGENPVSSEFEVDARGAIGLPLVGEVVVGGTNAEQAERRIAETMRVDEGRIAVDIVTP